MAASKTFIYPSVGGTIIAVVFPSILLLALSSAVAGTALPPGPTHAWAFDEPAGTTAYPTFGSQEGQLVNGAGRSTDGPFSYADNHSVDLLDDQDQALFPSHYSGTSGSFQFWAYQSEMHGGDYYLHTTGGSAGRIYLWVHGTGGATAGLGLDGKGVGGFPRPPDNTWNHFVVVWDESLSTGNVKVYLTNTSGQNVYSFTSANDGGDTGDIRMGYPGWGNCGFLGRLDEVAFWDVPLTADDVA